jgi:hypothetical protein
MVCVSLLLELDVMYTINVSILQSLYLVKWLYSYEPCRVTHYVLNDKDRGLTSSENVCIISLLPPGYIYYYK